MPCFASPASQRSNHWSGCLSDAAPSSNSEAAVPSSTRAARVERAKALGRAAYRLARSGTIAGNLEVEGEEKRLTEYRRS